MKVLTIKEPWASLVTKSMSLEALRLIIEERFLFMRDLL